MGVILDTSAVIGWLERGNQTVADVLAEHGEVPFVHVVTIGELHEGVVRAASMPDDVLRSREATLRFVLEELAPAPAPDEREARVFGVVSATTNRQLSHNDKWIVSRAALDGLHLVTEDNGLADAVESASLAAAVRDVGLRAVDVSRCADGR